MPLYNEPGSRKPIRHKDGSITYFDKKGNTRTDRLDGTSIEGSPQKGGGQILFEGGSYAGSVDRQHNGDYVQQDRDGQEVSYSSLQSDGTYRTTTQAQIKQQVALFNTVLGFNRRERKQKAREQAAADAHYAAAEARLFPHGNPAKRLQVASGAPAAPQQRSLHSLGVAALVLALLSIPLSGTLVVPVGALVLSIIAIKNYNTRRHTGRILGVLGLLLSLASFAVLVGVLSSSMNHY